MYLDPEGIARVCRWGGDADEIERDVANPTITTLNKIGRPFGYVVGFIHKGRV